MPKANDAPAETVSGWPLFLAICLLVLGAALNRRIGNDLISLVLAGAAILIPVGGLCIRAYLSLKSSPRIRRVYVDEDCLMASTRLESSTFLKKGEKSSTPLTSEEAAVYAWLRGTEPR